MAAWCSGQGSNSHIGDSEREGLNPVEAIIYPIKFFNHFFPFSLFPFVLTADPLKLCEDFAIAYL